MRVKRDRDAQVGLCQIMRDLRAAFEDFCAALDVLPASVGESKAKGQHWVPRFYLRYFAIDESRKRVMLCSKADQLEWKPVAIDDICQQKRMYTPTDRDGAHFTSFEALLSRVENSAAELWRHLTPIILRWRPSDRTALAEFMAILHLRNANLLGLCERVLKLRIQLYGLKDQGETEFNFDQPGPVFLETIMKAFGPIRDYFLDREWFFLRPAGSNRFITSDRPITFISLTGEIVGPKDKKASVYMPISPDLAIFMASGTPDIDLRSASVPDELVDRVNLLSRHHAIRFFISSGSLTG